MARALKYADAVTMLGGDSAAVAAVDRALGGALLVATGGGSALLADLLDARGEAVRVGHRVVGAIRDRRRGYSRYDRTQRLVAAHTLLVVTAFFEALDDVELPFDPAAVEVTAADQLHVAGLAEQQRDLVRALLDVRAGIPGPANEHRDALESTYRELADRWAALIRGLVVWDGLDAPQPVRRGPA